MRKVIFIAGAASVVAAGIGFAAGYKLAVHRLNDAYNEMLDEELDKNRAYYERNHPKFPDPVEAVKALRPEALAKVKEKPAVPEGVPLETLQRVVQDLKYNKITPAENRPTIVEVEETVVTVDNNVFDGDVVEPEEDPQYDEMVEDRKSQTIYIVSKAEHEENPHEFEMTPLTYFEGDNVLVDDLVQPIDNIDETIAHKENLQFGRWSGDPNVVYIRNEVLGEEFAILRSKGKYAVEVLGLDSD